METPEETHTYEFYAQPKGIYSRQIRLLVVTDTTQNIEKLRKELNHILYMKKRGPNDFHEPTLVFTEKIDWYSSCEEFYKKRDEKTKEDLEYALKCGHMFDMAHLHEIY